MQKVFRITCVLTVEDRHGRFSDFYVVRRNGTTVEGFPGEDRGRRVPWNRDTCIIGG